MEVIEYETPESWNDKGMDWNTPDPANADYVMAIRQALMERCAALHTGLDSRVRSISPWKTMSISAVSGIVSCIQDIAGQFVNIGWDDFKEDWSDFPRMWSYGDLVNERGCRICERAKYGSLRENGGWLKQIRNAIDRLTVIRAGNVYGKALYRSGSKHDPPFDESIGTAMQLAMGTLNSYTVHGRFPTSLYAWSGNTHWCWPMPKEEGETGDGGDGQNETKDGYCGYAQSQAYRITGAQSWLLGAQFDIFAAVIAKRPEGPVEYSQQLDTSIFDSGGVGFKMGLNWTGKVHVRDPYDFVFALGDADEIPKNAAVPVSEYDDKGIAIRRHSTKRGWTGSVHGFLDYGVEGGFRFR